MTLRRGISKRLQQFNVHDLHDFCVSNVSSILGQVLSIYSKERDTNSIVDFTQFTLDVVVQINASPFYHHQ